MRRPRETEEVYRALVAELAYTAVPTSVMGISLVAIGVFAYKEISSLSILLATVLAGIATTGKIAAIARHRRDNRLTGGNSNKFRMWERLHGLLTFCVAASVATISVSIFASNEPTLQILATAVVFGYAAGVASRISVRPLISASAITIATLPSIWAAAVYGGTTHHILAVMFAVFLLAGMQSVLHRFSDTTAEPFWPPREFPATEMPEKQRRLSLLFRPRWFQERQRPARPSCRRRNSRRDWQAT